ncbi:MAG TPA: patatin-like phospholipase family protein [Caulobacteraceae bacterium]|nr:patatin-like phospholipase family protein [Caulobacteraceae bacterium]
MAEPTTAPQPVGTRDDPLPIDLALQGGGAHGAFTWGVVERLFEEPTLRIESITGASAGSMNAVLIAHGCMLGGAAGVKAALERFWAAVSDAARFSPLQRTPFDRAAGDWSLDSSPGYWFVDFFSRLLSPYESNPANFNPLRDILEASVDFERLKDSPIKLFINATNVRTGLPRLFRNAELSADVILASACLPLMHQAIEIDGDPYWDGGFSGNPLLTPLIHDRRARDIVLVQINPVERPGTPTTARDILNRLNEISFNSSLKKELRGIAMFQQLVGQGHALRDAGWAEDWATVRLHRITTPMMVELSASSKLNAEWAFLCMLHDEGRVRADEFLRAHGGDLGVRASYDISTLLDTLLEQG